MNITRRSVVILEPLSIHYPRAVFNLLLVFIKSTAYLKNRIPQQNNSPAHFQHQVPLVHWVHKYQYRANITETVVFPTPPFPLKTRIICLTDDKR